MMERTLVLVTHHVDLVLPACSYVVRMNHGQVDFQGTVDELRERGSLSSLLRPSASGSRTASGSVTPAASTSELPDKEGNGKDTETKKTGEVKASKSLVDKEGKATLVVLSCLQPDLTPCSGSVSLSVYWTYIKTASIFLILLNVFLLIIDWLRSYPLYACQFLIQNTDELGASFWVKSLDFRLLSIWLTVSQSGAKAMISHPLGDPFRLAFLLPVKMSCHMFGSTWQSVS